MDGSLDLHIFKVRKYKTQIRHLTFWGVGGGGESSEQTTTLRVNKQLHCQELVSVVECKKETQENSC